MLQKHLLTLAQMQTLVIELQSTINDRPLGVTREDLGGPLITPNLLMYGREKNPPGLQVLPRSHDCPSVRCGCVGSAS